MRGAHPLAPLTKGDPSGPTAPHPTTDPAVQAKPLPTPPKGRSGPSVPQTPPPRTHLPRAASAPPSRPRSRASLPSAPRLQRSRLRCKKQRPAGGALTHHHAAASGPFLFPAVLGSTGGPGSWARGPCRVIPAARPRSVPVPREGGWTPPEAQALAQNYIPQSPLPPSPAERGSAARASLREENRVAAKSPPQGLQRKRVCKARPAGPAAESAGEARGLPPARPSAAAAAALGPQV